MASASLIARLGENPARRGERTDGLGSPKQACTSRSVVWSASAPKVALVVWTRASVSAGRDT